MRLIYESSSDKTLLFLRIVSMTLSLEHSKSYTRFSLPYPCSFLLAAKCFWFLSWIISDCFGYLHVLHSAHRGPEMGWGGFFGCMRRMSV